MSTNTELTFGEKAVGLSFNPSNKDAVYKVKKSIADIIDIVDGINFTSYLGNTIKGMAIRSLIIASMNTVKLLTFKD